MFWISWRRGRKSVLDTEIISKIASRLFPARTELTWNIKDVPPEERFWVISGKVGPRWIIPQNPQYGWPVLRQWRPYDFSSRLKWVAITAAYRTGRVGMLPGVAGVGVAGLSDSTWEHMGLRKDASPVPSIYVGTPGPTRKAVATLVAGVGHQAVSVVKVPLGPRAAGNILREANILERLASEKPGLAPSLIFVDREKGVAIQEMVEGQPTGRKLTRLHMEWLTGLRIPGEETSLREQAERLVLRLESLTSIGTETRSLLGDLLEELDDPNPLPAVWVHGDFAPWNIMGHGPLLSLVDWEDAQSRALPFLDIMHYYWIQRFLSRRKRLSIVKSKVIRICKPYIDGYQLPHHLLDMIEKLYMVFQVVERLQNDSRDQYSLFLMDY